LEEASQVLEVKAVLFDLWGTLIYNAPEHIDYPGIAVSLGVPAPNLFKAWRKYNMDALTGKVKSSEERATLVLTDLGLPLSGVPLLVNMEIKGRSTNINFYPGVPEMLATLRAKGFKTALISNSNYLTRNVVKEVELDKKLDELILSFEVGMVKPDEAIYRLVLTKLGLTAQECLYVGDGSDNEMQGAIAVGLPTALVEQERGYAFRNPGDFGTDLQFKTVTEVLNHVKLPEVKSVA
jgi:putative hydrolase of the HAD superfamily